MRRTDFNYDLPEELIAQQPLAERSASRMLTLEGATGAIADRRIGVGCDQLIVLEPPTDRTADVFMRIYNPDGGEAGACGNATRCVAHVLMGERRSDAVAAERHPTGLLRPAALGPSRRHAQQDEQEGGMQNAAAHGWQSATQPPNSAVR